MPIRTSSLHTMYFEVFYNMRKSNVCPARMVNASTLNGHSVYINQYKQQPTELRERRKLKQKQIHERLYAPVSRVCSCWRGRGWASSLLLCPARFFSWPSPNPLPFTCCSSTLIPTLRRRLSFHSHPPLAPSSSRRKAARYNSSNVNPGTARLTPARARRFD